ncbi:PREDICTED: uncharacterized protein LOC101306046 [Fragaria vesca subsp. vesca]
MNVSINLNLRLLQSLRILVSTSSNISEVSAVQFVQHTFLFLLLLFSHYARHIASINLSVVLIFRLIASMESIQVGSNTLNLELLINRNNYKKWRLQVKTYLLSEDLWDVVEANTEPPKLEDDQAGYKAWTKKNAKALHTIQCSCGPEMFPFISETESAKTAWEALEQECKVLQERPRDSKVQSSF